MSKHALLAAALCAALLATACSSNTTVTTVSPANISGDYTGTLTDGVNGTFTSATTPVAVLAQHDAAVGGTMTLPTSSGDLSASVSMTLANDDAFSGTLVVDFPNNGPTCAYSTSGTFTPSTNAISGSYAAISGCAGDSGTYALTQQCYDAVTNVLRRRMSVPMCH